MKQPQPKTYGVKPKKPNPFIEGKDKQKNRHGFKSEKRLSKKMGSKLMSGSGSQVGKKSDAILDVPGYQFRIESKATKNKSFSVKYDVLEKIRKEASDTGRTPVLTVSFTNELGEALQGGDYAMIPMWLFMEVFNNGD
ncbi:VHS1083 protein [Vibrio phage 1]|nr:VHS1083 protein [Vibrio phage 1]